MSRTTPSPQIRELARRLLAREAAGDDPSGPDISAGFRVIDKLRRPLSALAGTAGFRALLARSLTLAKAQVPALGAVRIKAEGSLEGFGDLGNQDQLAEAEVMLIAQLLELLVVLIGQSLTLNIILDVWPHSPLFNTELWTESDHAPTK
jgi:hypothetical protein